jgi:hypothetical protein
MAAEDPTFRDDLRRRVAQGRTPEMASASRTRFVLLQGLVILALGIDWLSALRSRPAQAWVSGLVLILLVAAAAWRYGRFSPEGGLAVTDDELASLSARSYRCGTCRTVVLPAESECPQCGALKHPHRTLAFGIAFGLAMTGWCLWRAGLFD